jgi:hypothetical protein
MQCLQRDGGRACRAGWQGALPLLAGRPSADADPGPERSAADAQDGHAASGLPWRTSSSQLACFWVAERDQRLRSRHVSLC